jgi:ferrous iron transport protein B
MNAEMKSAKWLWGGIGFQLGIGYTVAYLVYTIGTLITNPASLNVVAALIGLAIVLVFVAVICVLIRNTNKKLKAEYVLK